MSSKEDKKTKKKKTSKPAEGKAQENVEEPTAKPQEVMEEQQKPENVSHETPANIEEESAPDAEEEAISLTKPVPDASSSGSPAKEKKEDSKEDAKSRNDEKKLVKPMDIEKLKDLKEAFSLFDFNRDGIIDLQDLKYTFASVGKPDFPEVEMQKMLKEATEPVDFDAFVALFGYKVSTLDPEEVFTDALATWDMRGIGMIPEERLKRDIRIFGDKFSRKETDYALEEAPVYEDEGTPMIDYAKFSNNICGFRNVDKAWKYQKDLEKAKARK